MRRPRLIIAAVAAAVAGIVLAAGATVSTTSAARWTPDDEYAVAMSVLVDVALTGLPSARVLSLRKLAEGIRAVPQTAGASGGGGAVARGATSEDHVRRRVAILSEIVATAIENPVLARERSVHEATRMMCALDGRIAAPIAAGTGSRRRWSIADAW